MKQTSRSLTVRRELPIDLFDINPVSVIHSSVEAEKNPDSQDPHLLIDVWTLGMMELMLESS